MTPDSPHAARFVPSPNFGARHGRSIDAVVLHYTGMPSGELALARLCDAAAEVSCHYLVWEDGRIDQLVAERDRAWHAGRSCWAGERDINSISLGIEIVNAGHDGGCPPYPAGQIDALVTLLLDLRDRHAIAPTRVLAHADIAPERKTDPGEYFPWARLAAAGLCPWVAPAAITAGDGLRAGDEGAPVLELQNALSRIGYDVPTTGFFGPETMSVVAAFQRRHRPVLVDGQADPSTRVTLAQVRQTYGSFDQRIG